MTTNTEERRTKAAKKNLRKVDDFLSRFAGGIFKIPPVTVKSRELDRLCIAVQLIKRRFPMLHSVPAGILQFVSKASVEHEVRSMECLVDLMPLAGIKERGTYFLTGGGLIRHNERAGRDRHIWSVFSRSGRGRL